MLSGIHVGHYGVESTRGRSGKPPFRLWHLFRELDRIPGDWRMRLSSIEAAEIHGEFLKAAADCEKLCPQFHPSMQSGSDAVLSRMRRRYRIGRFLEKLDAVRDALGEVAFTTDVIVGFPGETDAEFEETLSACETAGYVKVHVFPFSARRGTPAATMPGQVPAAVKKERVARLGAFSSGTSPAISTAPGSGGRRRCWWNSPLLSGRGSSAARIGSSARSSCRATTRGTRGGWSRVFAHMHRRTGLPRRETQSRGPAGPRL